MRIRYDRGQGSDTGRWLYVSFGPGSGYVRPWYVALIGGPGNATRPGQDCGHKGLTRCNSAHCSRLWCNAQRWPLFGFFFVLGHTFRLWCGPTYNRRSFRAWRVGLRALLTWCKVGHRDTYAPISFR